MSVIKIENLTKDYGKNRGVKNINLEVKEGEVFGFIGPNGAGKSTTIKVLLNFIFPTSGTASILGLDVVTESNKLKELVGYVPSEVNYYDEVKVKDIIKYAASFYKNISKEEIDNLCNYLELDMEKKMEELSLGNKKKVAIAQSLIGNPKLLILDEPANGLDPLMQKKLFDIILDLKKKGVTVFLSSHNLVEVENFCDRVAVIKEGEIVKVFELSKEGKDLGIKVTVEGENVQALKDISFKIIEEDKNKLIFRYKDDINKLIGILSGLKISKLKIEEESLEDSFLSYYETEGGER